MEQDTYVIKITFDQQNNDPLLIFQALEEIVIGFKLANESISNAIHPDMEIVSYLVDIEKGSVLVKIRDALKKVPDDLILNSVKNPMHIVAALTVKAKQAIVISLEGIDGLSKSEQRKKIISAVKDVFKTSSVQMLNPINEKKLLSAASHISEAARKAPNNKLQIIDDSDVAHQISPSFYWSENEILTKTLPPVEMTATVKIKQPVYEGNAQWVVSYRKNIHVSIADAEWLKSFQSNNISAPPGSWLKVNMLETIELDENDDMVGEPRYEITKVMEVILPETLFDRK